MTEKTDKPITPEQISLPKRRMLSTTIYIRADQYQKLKALAHNTNIPVAQYVREGVDAVIEKYKHLLKD